MDEAKGVLMLDEVAVFLHTKPVDVRQLLESGKLTGFKIAGEWRILTVAVLEFLRREMAAAQQEALSRSLSDPRMWAHELQRMPALVALFDGQEFGQGTMGAFLKHALHAAEEEGRADNVLPFKPKGD
jgi:hypothetical protein